MYPTIRDGEAIRVLPVQPSSVRRGDIILYSWARGVIAHRVVEIQRPTPDSPVFVLRGDAQGSCDASVAPAQVLGRVVSVERNGRAIPLAGMRAGTRRVARLCASRLKVCAFSICRSFKSLGAELE